MIAENLAPCCIKLINFHHQSNIMHAPKATLAAKVLLSQSLPRISDLCYTMPEVQHNNKHSIDEQLQSMIPRGLNPTTQGCDVVS